MFSSRISHAEDGDGMSGREGSEPRNLTGVWNGLFRHADGAHSVSFTATLIDSGNLLTGSTHEPCCVPGCPHDTHMAMLSGRRDGTSVSFVKAYDPPGFGYHVVDYAGSLNEYATEIAGSWRIPPGFTGEFLMIRASRRTTARSRKKRAAV
jgi:hypothetical protein